MLIAFSIKNWKSFRDEVSFTVEASKERNHSGTVSKFNKFGLNLLPVTGIFGPNASGKSNFVKTLSFLQNLIVDPGRNFMSSEPDGFRLDPATKSEPTEFAVDLMLQNGIYSYAILFSQKKILEEKLSFQHTRTEKILFERKGERLTIGEPLKKDVSEDAIKFLTPFLLKNYPALNLLGAANIGKVVSVFNWFSNSLKIIRSDSPFISRLETEETSVEERLYGLGTGICSIKALPFSRPLSQNVERLAQSISEDSSMVIMDPQEGAIRISNTSSAGIKAEKLFALHKNCRGEEELFSFTDESAGTKRLFNLINTLDKSNSSGDPFIFVIDDIDRSLHTKLTSSLIYQFIDGCDELSRKQLIFTANDVQLIDEDLLRRDEFWICDRAFDGSTTLYPVTDFKGLGAKRDLQRSYLQGRFGGLPNLTASCTILNESYLYD